jgi:hypothetical protein
MTAIAKLWSRVAIVCLVLPLLAACATGPTFTDLQASEPAVANSMGRIYIYRSSALGAAVQPSVKVDGVVVGKSTPEGYFYVDRPAGSYTISTSTEVERDLSVTLEPGEKRYVRLDVSIGFFVGHISPTLMDDAKGAAEIKGCHYIGAH